MKSGVQSVTDYIEALPEDRKQAIEKLRAVVLKNLPKGFEEQISYNMVGYVVPHEKYPQGYHCNPKLPLPFMSFASQKNFIAVYHMGLYAMLDHLKWFQQEYAKSVTTKLDMGKSCIRFKKPEDIPYELIGKLVKRISMNDWISCYENNLKR